LNNIVTVADPEFYNTGGGVDCPAPSLNFYLKKVGFGAFWYDFLRSERHKKRHIRPAVLILYHSCIRQLSLKGRAQHLLTVLLVEYESYAKIAMVIGGGDRPLPTPSLESASVS